MKKLRKEIQFKTSGGLFDLFDNQIKEAYNITDDEYDYIAEHMTNDEMSIFLSACGLGASDETVSIGTIRQGILIRNKYLQMMMSNDE